MAEPRLSARGLCRLFPGGAGVHAMDLDVDAGEVHALVGLNGAGKTTLMRLLMGMLRPDAGTVQIGGHDLRTADPVVWASVGHLVDHPLAYPELDCAANLKVATRLQGVSSARVDAMVQAAIEDLDLGQYEHVRAARLSTGNRQRLGLAAALAHEPDLIVLDEPTSALDPRGVITLRELLLTRAQRGAGVLISSHHLDEVARVADRITVINRGSAIGSLDPAGTDIERSFFSMVHTHDEADTR
ncbi:MAG: ABC transporter ATP-binding protein [Ilumatobacteraceae bacterium]